MLELLRVGTATLSTLALLKHHIEPGNASELLTLISGGARLTIDLPRSRRLVGITWTRPLLEHSGCVQSNGRPANPWSRKRRNRTASALHATKRHGQCSVRERTRQLAEIDKKDDA
jgi:hypothetical protein